MSSILLITKNFPPQIGGIEKYSIDLFHTLQGDGNKVFLIKAYPRNNWLFTRSAESYFYSSLYYLSEGVRLFLFMLKAFVFGFFYSFQVEIIWSLDGSIAWIGFFINKISFHACVTRVTLHARDIVWNNYFYQKIMPFFWRKTNEVFCLNINMKEFLHLKGVVQASLITHYFVGRPLLKSDNFIKDSFLQSYNIPNNKILLWGFGRFVKKKGFDWFLKRVYPFLNLNKYHLILTGLGPLQNEYKDIVSIENIYNNVTFTGPVFDVSIKAKFFSSVDYLIMPTVLLSGDCEGYPITLLEAKYYNLPVVVSDNLLFLDYNNEAGCFFLSMDSDIWVDFFNAR